MNFTKVVPLHRSFALRQLKTPLRRFCTSSTPYVIVDKQAVEMIRLASVASVTPFVLLPGLSTAFAFVGVCNCVVSGYIFQKLAAKSQDPLSIRNGALTGLGTALASHVALPFAMVVSDGLYNYNPITLIGATASLSAVGLFFLGWFTIPYAVVTSSLTVFGLKKYKTNVL